MSGVAVRLRDLLDQRHVEYEVIHHHTDHTARQTAHDTHTPPREFAKTVFVWIDERCAMAVLPADRLVSEEKLRRALSAKLVRLASEEEFEALCPDCEMGAAPPFGNLYDLPVYVSPSLAEDEQITFNAGSHQDAIRMAYADFVKLVEPRVVPLASHD
jgi:Ala-tRNA(Pro) deacylase